MKRNTSSRFRSFLLYFVLTLGGVFLFDWNNLHKITPEQWALKALVALIGAGLIVFVEDRAMRGKG